MGTNLNRMLVPQSGELSFASERDTVTLAVPVRGLLT